jgi:uncharacterized protein YcfJ
LNNSLSSVRRVPGRADAAAPAPAVRLTFYENESLSGSSFATDRDAADLRRDGFNDRASSAVVAGGPWEICDAVGFKGRCMVLQPGQYASLAQLGLNDSLSSVRRVAGRADAAATAPAARLTFYENEAFSGRSFATDEQVADFRQRDFNDRAASVVVVAGTWEVCDADGFTGRCVMLQPGQYPSLAAMGLNRSVSSVRVVGPTSTAAGSQPAAPAVAEITFYENEGFTGRTLSTQRGLADFRREGFNDRASSVIVGAGDWEVCDAVGFTGRCRVLRPGQYPSLTALGLNDSLSSVRNVASLAGTDYRRRGNEPLYQAQVLAVRAVMGTAGQRCWVEREQVAEGRSGVNVPAAIVGAVLGGVLGHQVGGGRGKDLATVGGAVAGAYAGSTIGRGDKATPQTQEVQRCSDVAANGPPDHWDVTYVFQGQEHRAQMSSPPGATITVNAQGEPRI